jgi:hypothetical protein
MGSNSCQKSSTAQNNSSKLIEDALLLVAVP